MPKEIKWIDACEHSDIKLTDIKKYPVKHYLANFKTYGKIIKKDKDGIIIQQEITDDDEVNITAIPRQWVKLG